MLVGLSSQKEQEEWVPAPTHAPGGQNHLSDNDHTKRLVAEKPFHNSETEFSKQQPLKEQRLLLAVPMSCNGP
jgi:hypothetical protein